MTIGIDTRRATMALAIGVSTALAIGVQSGEAQAQENLIFGTGGTSGTYYPIGGALKRVFEDTDAVGNVQVVSTGASVANIQNIQDGLNQIAIVMSDVAYDAVNGQGQFEGNPVDLNAIAGLYPNVVQVVATGSSNVSSVADLEGARVGVGAVGSGVEQSAQKVLEAAGLTYDDLGQVSHTGYADSVTEMSNGNLDAAFFTSGVPNSSITGLMQSTNVTFVPVEGEVASKLLDEYPYYETYEIPAGQDDAYDLENKVDTVAIRNMLVVSASMDEATGKALASSFYDYLESGNVSVGALTDFDPNRMNRNLVVPIQAGAESFYESSDFGGSGGGGSGDGQSGGDSSSN